MSSESPHPMRLRPSRSHCLIVSAVVAIFAAQRIHAADQTRARMPNIIFLLADDLGYGDIGPYGQKKIRTPNLDRLAAEGMMFTAHYAGNNICAPSRCVLLSGKHPGHSYVRNNRPHVGLGDGKGGEGNEPVPAGELVFPLLLQRLGYATGGYGKWGLGAVGTTGNPLLQGFDHFFGYNDQAVAHNFYPTELWDDDHRIKLDNPKFSAHQKLPADADVNDPATWARFTGNVYAPDVINEKAREFLVENRNRPFFLYYPTTVPHLALQVPKDSLAEYDGAFPEEPYRGDRNYLPCEKPHATYAAMITRLDRDIGRLLDLVDKYGLRENTIVVFTSDNGPLFSRLGGTDTEFFDSTGGLRGRKGSNYEGGLRVPCIVRWPGHVAAGSRSDRVTGFEDWLPTFADLIGAEREVPAGLDGYSFAPTLLGKPQPPRPFLYREMPGYSGQQSVRDGEWKAIRTNLNPVGRYKSGKPTFELYNLADDPAEKHDLSAERPDVAARLAAILRDQHQASEQWPMEVLDGRAGPAMGNE